MEPALIVITEDCSESLVTKHRKVAMSGHRRSDLWGKHPRDNL